MRYTNEETQIIESPQNGNGRLAHSDLMDNGQTLMALNRSEIDIQISTAKQYPRSIKQFTTDVLEMATLDEETAASMFYAMPKDGKTIEGPSVRLAEIVGSAWGNMRYGSRIVSIDEKFVTAQGACHDLQKNVAITLDVKRGITYTGGTRRYSESMIGVTANAACSIALRQAIFKVVPFAYVKTAYEAARAVAIGTAETLASRRAKMMGHFGKMGVQEDRVLATIGRRGIQEVGLDDILVLRGIATAIKDGEMTVDEAFPAAGPDGSQTAKTEDLNAKLGKPASAGKPPAPRELPKPAAPINADADDAPAPGTDLSPDDAPPPEDPDDADADEALAGPWPPIKARLTELAAEKFGMPKKQAAAMLDAAMKGLDVLGEPDLGVRREMYDAILERRINKATGAITPPE